MWVFRAHEYGHIVLGHLLVDSRQYAFQLEAQADCFAAQHAAPQETLAAWQLFMNGGSSGNWMVYGPPLQRAERVRECAMSAGIWRGP